MPKLTAENYFQEDMKNVCDVLTLKIENCCKNIKGLEELGIYFKNGLNSLLENLKNAEKNLADSQKTIIYFDDNFIEIESKNEIENIERKIIEYLNELNNAKEKENEMIENYFTIIDKFINSNKNFEILDKYNPSCLIISSEENKKDIADELIKGKLIENSESFKQSNIEEAIEEDGLINIKNIKKLYKFEDHPIQSIDFKNAEKFLEAKSIQNDFPQILFLDIKNEKELLENKDLYGHLFSKMAQYRYKQDMNENINNQTPINFQKAPVFVIRSNDPNVKKYIEPSIGRTDVLWSSEKESLSQGYLAKDIAYSKFHHPVFMQKENLSEEQKGLYNMANLSEWERKTADTYKSLSKLHDFLKNNNYKEIIDAGVGDGRIAVPLAIMGYSVLGIDISKNQLEKLPQRIREVLSDLSSKEDLKKNVSTEALLKIDPEAEAPEIEKVKDKIELIEGNIFDIEMEIRTHLLKKGNIDLTNLDENKTKEIFKKQFDCLTFNWHTFCELGSSDNQAKALSEAYRTLKPGGGVFIEIPDRNFVAYSTELAKYHKQNPEEPFGIIRDKTSSKKGRASEVDENATVRFFPGRQEIKQLLANIGFGDINIETYLITNKDGEPEILEVKELVITAKKPKL